jgi:hypothetical protein
LTNGCRGNEGTLGHHARGLLSGDVGDREALKRSVQLLQKLWIDHTEARRVCVNMMTGVEVSIEVERSLMRFRSIFEILEHPTPFGLARSGFHVICCWSHSPIS